MSFVSYAQNFEDVMLWRALRHVREGFYLDIGAQDPVVDSVSKAFYDHGWRGWHIEPTPHYASALRAARPDETVLQVALGETLGALDLFEIDGTGLSTTIPEIAEVQRARGRSSIKLSVPVLTLDHVFEQLGAREIHWMKIDVEGAERDVLGGWRDHSSRPWVVVVEATSPSSQELSHASWEGLVLEKGYTFVHFDGLNRFYISNQHTELADAFAAPANVFDDFELAGTGSHTFCAGLNRRLQATIAYAEGMERERDAILQSKSWRLTEPVRRVIALIPGWKDSTKAISWGAIARLRALGSTCLRSAIPLLQKHPRIVSAIGQALRYMPSLHRWLVKIERNASARSSNVQNVIPVAESSSLSPWARTLLKRLESVSRSPEDAVR